MKRYAALLVVLMILASALSAQTVVGKWKQIDDETGKKKSIIETFIEDGKLYGKIVKLFRDEGEEQNPICDKCKDDRKNQPLIGMEIIRDMTKNDDGAWTGDKAILDPKKGKIYDCKIWLESDDVLKVQGQFLFIHRTQTWYRVEE